MCFESRHWESLQHSDLHLKIRVMPVHGISMFQIYINIYIYIIYIYIIFSPPLHAVWSHDFQDFFVHSLIAFNLVSEVDRTLVAEKQGVSRKYNQGQNVIDLYFASS